MCRRPATLALAAALAALAGLAGARPAAAEPPVTRFGVLAGARTNLGELGRRYALGYVLGTEAGLQKGLFGLGWSLQRGQFFASSAEDVAQTLDLWEMSFSGRVRLHVRGDVPAFVFAGASLDLLRASFPIPPDERKTYVGPAAGGGVELVLGNAILSLGAQYGLLVGGPSGLKLLLFVGVGSP